MNIINYPNDWMQKELCKVGKITSGGTPDTANSEYWNGEINWCTPTDITNLNGLKYIGNTQIKISEKGLKKSSAVLLPVGTIIVCTRATIGKAAISNDEISTNQGFKNIIPDNNKVDTEFLYYIIIDSEKRLIRLGNGSTFLEVPKRDFEKFKIPLPPLPEQKAIAHILGLMDEAINKNNKLIAQKELRKKWLMQNLLTGKKRLKGFADEWKEFTYDKLLKVVKRLTDWDDNRLYNLISVRRRSGGIFRRESLYGHQIKVKDLRDTIEGDFLFSKMQIVHGASALVTKEFAGCMISGSYIAVIAKDESLLNIEYFNWYSKTPFFYHQTYISSYGVHIEKMTFDFELFLELKMKLPSLKEQTAIANVLQSADKEIQLLKVKTEKLKEQKKWLMQVLLTGKKRLKL